MPLLVGHFFGKGYVLFVGFDDTWRWRFNTQEKVFGRFWSQAVYTAGIRARWGPSSRSFARRHRPTLGKSGQVYARVFNENFQLPTAPEIEATLERVDADPNAKDRFSTITLDKAAGQDGEYVAPLSFNKVGRFKLTVDPRNKTPATLDYRVNLPPDHELAPGGLDETAMPATVRGYRRHLRARGGPLQASGDGEAAGSPLSPAGRRFSCGTAWRLFAVIGLLTMEWVLRKYNGLS